MGVSCLPRNRLLPYGVLLLVTAARSIHLMIPIDRHVEGRWPPQFRIAGISRQRYRLLDANTPWKRVRLTGGLGTKAVNRR